MATKRKTNGNGKKKTEGKSQRAEARTAKARWHSDLKPETKKSVFAVLLFLITAFLVLSYIGQGGAAGGVVGLKENVIIGRLIPAGTGYRKNL